MKRSLCTRRILFSVLVLSLVSGVFPGTALSSSFGKADYTTLKYGKDHRGSAYPFLMITTALFFLSPTQFPWYGLWILPFLTLAPRKSLLLLTPLLPLFYLRPFLQAKDLIFIHDLGLVWVQSLPVLVLLFLEWRSGCPGLVPITAQDGSDAPRHTDCGDHSRPE